MTHYHYSPCYESFEIGGTLEQAYSWAIEQADKRRAEGHTAHVADFEEWESLYAIWFVANRFAATMQYVLYEFYDSAEFQSRLIGVYATEALAEARKADIELLRTTDDVWAAQYLIEAVPFTPAEPRG